MQIVFLSSRPAILAETWTHLRHFMPWLGTPLVVGPESAGDAIDLGEPHGFVSDEELCGATTAQLVAMDHTTRNFTIRGALAHHDAVAGEFLMADDDYRPLKPVGLDQFRTDGRDRCFYFYDLDAWPGADTPFDEGLHNVRELLAYLGHDRLAFASHMPQLVRKEHLAETRAIAHRLTDCVALDEWSLYFGVARARHPDDFCDPEPFRTLCWPQYPNEWPWWVRPPEYVFENFYPQLYEPGHLFAGLPTALDPDGAERTNVEKILRWSRFGRRSARLEFPDGVANPWTAGSPLRKAGFGVLRRLQHAFDYVALDQRTRTTELQGRVARLEEDLRRAERP